MMWLTLTLFLLICTPALSRAIDCRFILDDCLQDPTTWTRCYEDSVGTCKFPRVRMSGFSRSMVNSSQEAEARPTLQHIVRIPSLALQKSMPSHPEVLLVATVINSTHFKQNVPKGRGRLAVPHPPVLMQGIVLGEQVLAVRAGNNPVTNLSQPIQLIFKHNMKVKNAVCAFWQLSSDEEGTGQWSKEGCETNKGAGEFICSCNHLSFFAVLVNPDISVDESNAKTLNFIAYIGSGLSVLFGVISLFIYIDLHHRRPEKSTRLHMQLTGALLCLHISFLLCSFWFWLPNKTGDSLICKGLGLVLHWSLLATFTWIALEGFHLYLLLIRVFNIYVQRYLLKLSMVGWGLPTLVALVCGVLGVYGKYSLEYSDANNLTSTAQMCWMSSDFPQRPLVSYITVAFLGLVIMYNSCMLAVVVFKIWGIRGGRGGVDSCSNWKRMKEKGCMLWKDSATVLGLSCVLGLPWGLASTTYISLPGIYIFTIFNSLQGLFLFLWSVALSCKSRSDVSSVKEPSSQKMMTTSFNN